MIKVLLFDFYGVFLPDSYAVWLKDNSLLREGIFADLIRKRDRGEISEPDFLGGLSLATKRTVTIDEIHPKVLAPDLELIQLVRSLKSDYKVCLFSNASPSLHDKLKALNITDIFDEIILSSEIGHAKPSDEAYAIAIKNTGVDKSEILFFDDNPDNISAALKNGIRSYLYTSVDSVREAIKDSDD